tara:strand:- start:49 stop:621 length:573 start_codon:yes stop_codon:yes gene_type:complete
MSKTKKRTPTNETRKKVEELLDKGMLQQDIANELGLTEATISHHASKIRLDNLVLSDGDINIIKRGHVNVANSYLNDKIPMLKDIKLKMKEFEALRPIHSLLNQSKSDKLINKCKEALNAKLNAHISGENELTARDLSSITGSINNIAALEERQRQSVTPKTIEDMPAHMVYANAGHQVIDVDASSDSLI